MRIICIPIFIILTFNLLAQNTDTTEITCVFPIEESAVFPGEPDSLWCFLERNFNYDRINAPISQGKIFVEYIIDTTGKVSNIEINPSYIHSDHLIKDSMVEYEISRVIRKMPQWKPASQNGKKVKQKCLFSIILPYRDFKCNIFPADTSVYWIVDKPSEFLYGNGGSLKSRIDSFVYKHIQWPNDLCYTGSVIIQCIIESKGELSNFKIIRSLSDEFDQEALRVVKLMKDWTPSFKNGKPVRSFRIISIRFR